MSAWTWSMPLVLHVLRNPHGYSEELLREARLLAADEIERLEEALRQAECANGMRELQRLRIEELERENLRLRSALEEIRDEARGRLQPGEYSSLADRIDRMLGQPELPATNPS